MTPQSFNESESNKQILESKTFKKSDQYHSKDDQELQSILNQPETEKEESPVRNGLAFRKVSPVTQQQQRGAIEESGRERLKRHRVEVAGKVWIPEMWGQEELLKDWIDCSAFDASLMNSNIMLARAALVQQGRRSNSTRLRIENSC